MLTNLSYFSTMCPLTNLELAIIPNQTLPELIDYCKVTNNGLMINKKFL